MLQYLDQTHYTFGENKMLNLPAGLIFRTAMLKVTKKTLFNWHFSKPWELTNWWKFQTANIDLGIKTIDLYMDPS